MSKTTVSSLSQRNNRPSRSAAVRARLDYPVIDTDLHTIEFVPLFEEYLDKIGGPGIVDQFRSASLRGFAYLSNDWYVQSPEERQKNRAVRPPWWVLPTKNTLDLATVTLPKLLHERLEESGTDFAVLYPNVTTFAIHIGNPELRRAVIRAVNTYHADIYRPYADRLTPVAAVPLHTPQEGIEFAIVSAWLATIGAEYLMTSASGIGGFMIDGREQFRMDIVLLGTIVTGIVGWLLISLPQKAATRVLRSRVTLR